MGSGVDVVNMSAAACNWGCETGREPPAATWLLGGVVVLGVHRHGVGGQAGLSATQGRVTDHRVGHTEHGIEGVLSGARLDAFIDALHAHHREQLLAGLGQ